MSNSVSATELARFNTECDESFGENYIESLDCVTVFRDEIKKNLPAAGFIGDPNNTADIIDFVCKCCKKTFPSVFDDPNDKSRTVKFNSNTLSRWIGNDDVPVSNIVSREIMYKLCFALGMDEVATRNFFYKGCLERPFNFKNIRESVYYFCLKHRKNYLEAEHILDIIETTAAIDNPDADNLTSVIANRIKNIRTVDELISYLVENRSGFTHHNNSAYQLIENELLPLCKKLATRELPRINVYRSVGVHDKDKEKKLPDTAPYPWKFPEAELFEDDEVDSVDSLLTVIYGYNARATFKNEKIFKYSISDKAASKFPRLIKENFPQREQFQQIAKREASASVVRKALIMLKFYEFFTQAYLDDPMASNFNPDIWEEFVDEMNTVLEICGYVQLYWRNPFDWMIGHCAREATDGRNPVDRLRDLIDTFYLSHQE